MVDLEGIVVNSRVESIAQQVGVGALRLVGFSPVRKELCPTTGIDGLSARTREPGQVDRIRLGCGPGYRRPRVLEVLDVTRLGLLGNSRCCLRSGQAGGTRLG